MSRCAEVKALACQLPIHVDKPLSRWSGPELVRHVIEDGIVNDISASTILRWLRSDALKPWQQRSWIFPRDPAFASKASVVLDLYAGRFDGKRLGPGDFVISSDEKTSIQCRRRVFETLPPSHARPMRVEHEYERGGAVAYMGAWDVQQGKIMGRCEEKTGIEPFGRLVEQVMTQEPYRSARHVYWVVDNGSSHRGDGAVERLHQQFPNAVMVHTPIPRRGSIRSRSSSRSCNARSSVPTILQTSTKSKTVYLPSKITTTPLPNHSTGLLTRMISTTYCNASINTRPPHEPPTN